MDAFTPWTALLGGAIIGLAALMLYAGNGRLAGISAIFAGVFYAPTPRNRWRWMFIAGLVAGGLAMALIEPTYFPREAPRPVALLALAGVLVGFGTRLGGGCTSGHGICGNARLSRRSMVATVTFIATGALAVLAARALLVGGVS
jgi:hypothetical protein